MDTGHFVQLANWSVAQLEQDSWASEALTEWSRHPKQHIMRSKCHAKQQCWANIFGSKSNSFLRVSTLNADLRGSPFANHLLQTFWDSDKLYLIDVAFVGKSKTRREPRGQPCTNNTYNIWRESTVKKSSRLHGHGTFRPTCELERGPTGARQLGIRGSYGME